MCFYIPEEQPKALIAKKDIPVFKLMNPARRDGRFTNGAFHRGEILIGRYKSWHLGFEYADGFEYSNDNFRTLRNRYHRGEGEGQGLHSFTIGKKAFMGFGKVKVKCYIPKGAYYFYNKDDGEYFSSHLVIVGKMRVRK